MTSCSFVEEEKLTQKVPKTIFENINLFRYEAGERKFFIRADLLESYPSQKTFAAQNLYIVQYKKNTDKKNPKIDFKASAKEALFMQKEELFFLGGEVFLQTSERQLTVFAKNLFYNQKENMLYGAKNEKVKVTDKDNTEIMGANFVANTLSNEFKFSGSVEGSVKTELKETFDKNAEIEDEK